MLAFLSNIGPTELLLIAIVAVLIWGKNLPQAASKAYLQARKLRNAVDDLRRETGIDRELRNLERSVREAEWEARRTLSEAEAATRALPVQGSAPPTGATAPAPPPPPAPEPPAAAGPERAPES